MTNKKPHTCVGLFELRGSCAGDTVDQKDWLPQEDGPEKGRRDHWHFHVTVFVSPVTDSIWCLSIKILFRKLRITESKQAKEIKYYLHLSEQILFGKISEFQETTFWLKEQVVFLLFQSSLEFPGCSSNTRLTLVTLN